MAAGPMDGAIRRPFALTIALLAAGFVALSIHVGMLSLGVAYPQATPPIWARWANSFCGILGLLAVLALARPTIGRYGFMTRWLIAFVIVAAIRETLRNAVMNGVVTGGWAFSLIGLAEPVTRMLITSLACTVAVRWIRSGLSLLFVSILTAAALIIVQLPIAGLFAPLTGHFAYLSRPDAYQFPYPIEVMIPAYLSFAEAVLGAAIATILIWDRLPGSPPARAAAMGLLVASIKGVVIATFLFAFFMEGGILAGMLSYSQFLLEFLALGMLVGLAWARFGDPDAKTGRII